MVNIDTLDVAASVPFGIIVCDVSWLSKREGWDEQMRGVEGWRKGEVVEEEEEEE